MLVTNNRGVAEKVRILRNYGQQEQYHHIFLAYNRRLDTLQAAILRVKLKYLDSWNAVGRSTVNRGHEHHRSIRRCSAREGRPRRFGGAQRGSRT